MNAQIVADMAQAIDDTIDKLIDIKRFGKNQLNLFFKQQQEEAIKKQKEQEELKSKEAHKEEAK
ncbi:MAG: hypothetical protein WC495_03710 [Patescibacteria group bacterium]|jgi:hypothetical protein